MVKFGFDGTSWQIETQEPLDTSLCGRILERIERFDATYSRFRGDSLVSQIASATKGGIFEFPEDAVALFDLYDRLYTSTDGAVDPLVGRDLELLGYDRSYSLRPDPKGIADYARGRPNWSKDVQRERTSVATPRPLVIDVGAAGKGYLVDIIAGVLCEQGFAEFIVNGSGDLLHSGSQPLDVGLKHPFDPSLVIGVARLKDRALCASAINRRAWGDGLHHVIDGRTGLPARGVVATWVIADDTATADGLSTALFFVPAERLAAMFRFTCVRMFEDGRAELSADFEGELFT